MGMFGHFGERIMAGVRFGLSNQFAPPAVPFPNQFRVPLIGFRGGELLRVVLGPKTGLGIAKGGNPAFGRGACAGKQDDVRSPKWLNMPKS